MAAAARRRRGARHSAATRPRRPAPLRPPRRRAGGRERGRGRRSPRRAALHRPGPPPRRRGPAGLRRTRVRSRWFPARLRRGLLQSWGRSFPPRRGPVLCPERGNGCHVSQCEFCFTLDAQIKAKDLLLASQTSPIHLARHLASPHPSLTRQQCWVRSRSYPQLGSFSGLRLVLSWYSRPKGAFKTHRKP